MKINCLSISPNHPEYGKYFYVGIYGSSGGCSFELKTDAVIKNSSKFAILEDDDLEVLSEVTTTPARPMSFNSYSSSASSNRSVPSFRNDNSSMLKKRQYFNEDDSDCIMQENINPNRVRNDGRSNRSTSKLNMDLGGASDNEDDNGDEDYVDQADDLVRCICFLFLSCKLFIAVPIHVRDYVPQSIKASPVVLLPHQTVHAKTIVEIFNKSFFAIDLSMMGAGKTYSATHVAHVMGFNHVVVVCPVSVQSKWKYMKKRHGLRIDDNMVMGYELLRASKNRQPSHGLLSRADFVVTSENNVGRAVVEYHPTDKLLRWASEGLLVIFDEIQHFKNRSTQFLAFKSIMSVISKSNNKSKTLLLSGSPMDKPEQAQRLFIGLGIMTKERLSHIGKEGCIQWDGLSEISDFCKKLDPKRFKTINNQVGEFSRGNVLVAHVFELFNKILKPNLASVMPPPDTDFDLNKFNGFFQINPNDQPALLAAVRRLKSVCSFSEWDGSIERVAGIETLAAITAALMAIELAKVKTLARLVVKELKSNPSSKVAVCLNYSEPLLQLKEQLESLKIPTLVLNGSIPAAKRMEVLEAFQAPNLNNRVLLGNCRVCSTGIDLDDKYGNFPRTAFISPNYSTLDLHQLTHRFLRVDSKNDATVYFVYGHIKELQELPILEALAKKSEIMKQITPEQVNGGVVFQFDLQSYEEPHN